MHFLKSLQTILIACILSFPSILANPWKNYTWDLHQQFPWLPPLPTTLTDAQRDSMQRFSSSYPLAKVTPNGQGNEPQKLDQLMRDIDSALPLPTDTTPHRKVKLIRSKNKNQPDGQLPPIAIDKELKPLLERVLHAYAHANDAQAPTIEALYRRIAHALMHSDFHPGGKRDGWLGNGYGWRNWGQKFVLMDHTLPKLERQYLLECLAYTGEGHHLYKEAPYANTDLQLNFYYNVLRFISRMDDGPAKWQRLLTCRRGLDLAVTQDRYLTPDGGIIHHNGHHISYASYSHIHALQHQINFAKAGIFSPHSKRACQRYRAATTAWAFNSLRSEIPYVMQLRPAPSWENSRHKGQGVGLSKTFAIKTAELTTATFGSPIEDDREMARIITSKMAGDSSQLPDFWKHYASDPNMLSPLQGHRPFPVMGNAVHRHKNAVIMLRGANRYYRGGEVYADAGYPGAYMDRIMHGALFIFSRGDEGRFPNTVDSGYRTEGYDPNLFPNVTAAEQNNPDLAGRYNPDYLGSGAKQGGGVSLNGFGVWAWNPGHVQKSGFFFGNRISLFTTGITIPKPNVRTALLQSIHDQLPGNPLTINAEVYSQNYQTILPSDRSHTLLDASQTGYYIPKGNPPIHIRRGNQGYTYALSSQLKPGAPKNLPSTIKNRQQLRESIDQFSPIIRPASLAYFDHGNAPNNDQCHFHVLVNSSHLELKKFHHAMESSTPPIYQDIQNHYHYLIDQSSQTHALVTFQPDTTFTHTSLVQKLNRPSTLMWHQNKNHCQLVIGSTDLKNNTPFSITLEGHWKLHSAPSDTTLTQNETTTTLTIPYLNQLGRSVSLMR
ncbi:hypothetical protein ACFSW8_16865 [Rubritalea tangerina]|uniref:Chondroitin AC lyase n=2 Tax=Rubritalea tangerina TaxID=430798 RepID=A0ABW4ZEX6_9BACT